MTFLLFLVALFILLVLVTVSTTLINIVFKLVTKNTYETYKLLIPALLSIILWIIILLVFNVLSESIYKINVINVLLDSLLAFGKNKVYLLKLISLIMILSIFGIIIQAFLYLTVNMKFPKVFKKFSKTDETSLAVIENDNKLSFINAFTSSIFMFSIIFFVVLLLLATGNIIARQII